jgi:hypothetical protein
MNVLPTLAAAAVSVSNKLVCREENYQQIDNIKIHLLNLPTQMSR